MTGKKHISESEQLLLAKEHGLKKKPQAITVTPKEKV